MEMQGNFKIQSLVSVCVLDDPHKVFYKWFMMCDRVYVECTMQTSPKIPISPARRQAPAFWNSAGTRGNRKREERGGGYNSDNA